MMDGWYKDCLRTGFVFKHSDFVEGEKLLDKGDQFENEQYVTPGALESKLLMLPTRSGHSIKGEV